MGLVQHKPLWIAFLIFAGCWGFAASAQSWGYYVLQNPPSVNRAHHVKSMTLWRTPLDTLGNVVGKAMKEKTYVYDSLGRIVTETHYDSSGQICSMTEYRGALPRFIEEDWGEISEPPMYSECLRFKGPQLLLVEHFSIENTHYTGTTPYYFFKPCYGDYLATYRADGLMDVAMSVTEKHDFSWHRTSATQREYLYWARYDFVYTFW